MDHTSHGPVKLPYMLEEFQGLNKQAKMVVIPCMIVAVTIGIVSPSELTKQLHRHPCLEPQTNPRWTFSSYHWGARVSGIMTFRSQVPGVFPRRSWPVWKAVS